MAEQLRILYYCHDTYGLGHISRSITAATFISEQRPGTSQLIVTGSPVAGDVRVPPGADYVKLPCVTKTGPEQYGPRSLATDFQSVRAMRAEIIVSAARHFRPHLVVVDHAPAGMGGEVVPALRYLKRSAPEARLVIGLRDVTDAPDRAIAEWRRAGAFDLFDSVYDHILVYGQPDVLDVARSYGLTDRAAAKLAYVGYLRREPVGPSRHEWRERLGVDEKPLVLATVGGGGDGYPMLRRLLEDVRQAYPSGGAPFHTALVSGPFMADRRADALRALGEAHGDVTVLSYVPQMSSLLAAADAVVSMAGYNTVCEILSFQTPAVLVPRTEPRQEQLLRSAALARRGLVRMVHPNQLHANTLLREVQTLLRRPHRPFKPVSLSGLPNFLGELEALHGGASWSPRAARTVTAGATG